MVTDWSEELKSPSPIPKIPSTSEASGPTSAQTDTNLHLLLHHTSIPLSQATILIISLLFQYFAPDAAVISLECGPSGPWVVVAHCPLSQAQVKRPSHCHGRLLFAVDSFELVVEKYPSPSKLLLSMSVKPCVEEQALEPATPPISYQRKKHTTYQSKR